MKKKVVKHILLSGNVYLAGIFFCVLVSLGIIMFQPSFLALGSILLTAAILALVLFKLLRTLRADWYAVARNLVDFFEALIPLQKQQEPINPLKKRILIFNWRDKKHIFSGGAEVYTHELATRWVKEGHVVTIFCGNDGKNPRHEVYEGVEVIRRGGFYFVYVWAFLYYMMRYRNSFDFIIDCENGIPFFTPLYAKQKVFLLIHHVHQEVFRTSLTPPFSWLASFLELKLMPLVYKNVQVITVSESSKKEILHHKITKTEPIVVHNGVDLTKFQPAKKSIKPMILYLGRLQSYKSLDVLIKAAPKILEKFPEVEFTIAGFGEEERKLRKLTKKLNISEKFNFLGRVTEEEKISLYQKAWVFVNPSMMEGWGITTIEANACGTPVVASNVPGLKDSVKNPHTGFLVEYGNDGAFAEKIMELLDDKQMLTVMSHEAIVWAEQFDWNKSADKILKLL
ncbi:MAG TPA: glycosyltransferase [Candidatus Saccharimonadales bacterium]|nr:glycosyltransferase [Candidatus Saccharimonadales bacterium]